MKQQPLVGLLLAGVLVAAAAIPSVAAPSNGNGNANASSNGNGNGNASSNGNGNGNASNGSSAASNGNGNASSNGNGSSNAAPGATADSPNASTESSTPATSNGQGAARGIAQGNAAGNSQGNSQGAQAAAASGGARVDQQTAASAKDVARATESSRSATAASARIVSASAREQVKARSAVRSKAKRTALARCVSEQLALLGTEVALEPTPEQLDEATEVCEAAVGSVGAYIVMFTPGTNANSQATKARESKVKVGKVYTDVFPGMAITATDRQIVNLQRNPNVRLIEADGLVQSVGTDTTATWGLDRIDQRSLPLDQSYTDNGSGSGVTAYVVDTGIRSSHADFSGRVRAGFTSISDSQAFGDCNGHGTHVAGTIGGSEYGVAEAVTLVPVRVLDCAGSGPYSGVIAGLDWIMRDHAAGPAVANLSLGGGFSSAMNSAVESLVADGVTVAVAAGNSNADACSTSPASARSALTVGATTSSDARASYSNFGTCLDIFAPGSGITSAWYTSDGATNTISGTSMASPHVAGAAAALLSREPALSPADVASRLISSATPDIVTSVGTGSPNRLLHTGGAATPTPTPTQPTATAPTAPTSVSATPGKRRADVRWTLGSDGGSPFTGHTVRIFTRGAQVGTVSVVASATSVSIRGLQPATSYTFTVVSANAIGTSPESVASAPVTTLR